MKTNKPLRVLFFSSVRDTAMFRRAGFYREDIDAIRNAGHLVTTTNQFRDALFFWKYDALFAYFWKKSLIPIFFSRLLGKRVVVTGGADELDPVFNKSTIGGALYSFLFFLCHFFCNIALVQSQSDLTNMRRIVGNSRKLQYSPLAVSQKGVEAPGLQFRKPWIVSIAWMESKSNTVRKGLDRAVELLFEIRKLHPEYELFVLGTEGEGTVFLRGLIEKLGQSNAVRFIGPASEEQKVQYLREAQFYLQLSQYEGFGLAVLEAMANGCIVAHSNRGGLADTAGENGVILPLELRTKDMAKRIISLSKEPEIYENLQRASQAKAATFTSQRRSNEIGFALERM